MKKHILLILSVVTVFLSGCDSFLDRPQKSNLDDNNYWSNEANLRLFANGFYFNYFVGYNTSWGTAYTPFRGYNFADDFVSANKQSNFANNVPSDNWYRTEGDCYWIAQHNASPWNFAWVRKANIMLNRIETMKENGLLSDEAYNHWTAIARFFRGMEYSRLVESFGDVPYYDIPVSDTDLDVMYKERDSRTTVMDNVLTDFEYVLNNMRENDGNAQYVNKYIAAAFISRYMLFEGTWQTYQSSTYGGGNAEKAKSYLNLAIKAAEVVMNSGKYEFDVDFRTLFGSESLAGVKEVIIYREYNDAQSVRHCIASYSNLTESQGTAANLDLAKDFICNDGQPWATSGIAGIKENWDLKTMAVTRDPRFEATFWDEPNNKAASLLYQTKFIDREGVTYYGGAYPSKYGSNTNTNDAPVMRLAEVVLNWIEAKAVLMEEHSGAALTQDDLDKSINAIRNRPLDAEAIAKGVKKTAPLDINNIPSDPEKDATVSDLMWEIRRERRMEFVFEHSRMLDLKRWAKIQYMDGSTNPDILKGIWCDFSKTTEEAGATTYFDYLTANKIGELKVEKLDGTVVTYDGTNAADMVGFYIPVNVQNRDAFTDRVYLAPICTDVTDYYAEKGYSISQNPGW